MALVEIDGRYRWPNENSYRTKVDLEKIVVPTESSLWVLSDVTAKLKYGLKIKKGKKYREIIRDRGGIASFSEGIPELKEKLLQVFRFDEREVNWKNRTKHPQRRKIQYLTMKGSELI